MAFIKPPIDMVGAITLSDPFTNAVVPNLAYRVTGLRTLVEIASSGDDPYELYYAPANISLDKYQADLIGGVCIISLQSSSGIIVKVPNSYLTSLPSAGGIPYSKYVVGVDVGMLPDNLDLTYFKSQMASIAHDLLGVNNAVVQEVIASDRLLLTQADSKAIETTRKTIMSAVVTDRALYLQEKALRQSAEAKIAILEQFINDNLDKLNQPT